MARQRRNGRRGWGRRVAKDDSGVGNALRGVPLIAGCRMRSEIIEAVGSDGVGLKLVFKWDVDRYCHAISVIGRDGRIMLLAESMNGSVDDDWPPSPPLQTLSIENLPDGRSVALLVGMAGRSHWSASIEPVNGQSKLIFDIACRHSGPPRWLGSRYLQMSMLASSYLSIESGNARISEENEVVEIVPQNILPRGTSRWRFVVSAKLEKSGVGETPPSAPPKAGGAAHTNSSDASEMR